MVKHQRRIMAKIIIIGAGLTGLSAAYHLEKKGFYDYALFEKESTVVGFPHNFASAMAPSGCSSLYGEYAYLNKSQHWKTMTLNHAVATTKKLLDISEADVITEKIIDIPHAYVIYDFWREKHLPKLLARLEEQSVYSVGRYGAWKYSSMQEAILDGKKIVEKLIVIPARRITSKTVTSTEHTILNPRQKEIQI